MPDQTVSQMTQVDYKSTLLLPVVDMTAPVGMKNVALPVSTLMGGARIFVSAGAPDIVANAGDLCTNPTGAVGERLYLSTNGEASGWVALA
ncbi:MAG: hypothetical protein ACYCZB_17780 [Acidiphilium sp.]